MSEALDRLYDSLEGYLVKVEIRTARTVFVEGSSDASVIGRLIVETGKTSTSALSVLVDTAEMIQGIEGVYSNREKAELVHRLAGAPDKIAVFVDREFRGMSLADPICDEIRKHEVVTESCFWSRGHSTENYFFAPEYVIRFLEFWYPAGEGRRWNELIMENFRYILLNVAALSIVLHNQSLLKRASGIFRKNHWRKFDGIIELDVSKFADSLRERAVPQDVCTNIREYFASTIDLLSRAENPDIRWLVHGHLGWEGIWAAIAKLLSETGILEDMSEVVERGQIQVKQRCVADLWVSRFEAYPEEHPSALTDWLRKEVAA